MPGIGHACDELGRSFDAKGREDPLPVASQDRRCSRACAHADDAAFIGASWASNPHGVYCDSGWLSYADWLGYGTGKEARAMSSKMREYTAAREWVRGLGLESTAEWFEFCASGEKPEDIPRSDHAEVPCPLMTSC